MVIMPAFQAGYGGSIPLSCSNADIAQRLVRQPSKLRMSVRFRLSALP